VYDIDSIPGLIELGHLNEKGVCEIEFDVTEWLADYPLGVLNITYIRPGETDVYPVDVTGVSAAAPESGNLLLTVTEDEGELVSAVLTWTVSDAVTAIAGSGTVVVELAEGGTIKKRSDKVQSYTADGHAAAGTPPEPLADYIEKWSDVDITVTGVAHDVAADGDITQDADGTHISLDIPAGHPGVYVGTDEPTDPDVMVWIDEDDPYDDELQDYLDAGAAAQTAAEAARDLAEGYAASLGDVAEKFEVSSANESAALGDELASGTGWTLGAGWAGDFATGFVHTAGQTEALTFTMPVTTQTNVYQIEFDSLATAEPAEFIVQIGNSTAFEVYRGATEGVTYRYKFGIKSVSSGDFVITPNWNYVNGRYAGTISNISIKQITGTITGSLPIKDEDENILFETRPTETSLKNTYIGVGAGRKNTSGDTNIGIGYQAMYANTSGYWNTALGYQALMDNTVGSRNICLGAFALMKNLSGHRNIVLGTFAMRDNTHGHNNIVMGADACWNNETGNYNISFGLASMAQRISGEANIAIGKAALGANTAGSYHIAIGDSAASSFETTGANETLAIGHDAMRNTTTGTNNVAIGGEALMTNITGGTNTAIGRRAMQYGSSAKENVAVGYYAGRGAEAAAAVERNVFLGYATGAAVTSAKRNVLIGYAVGDEITSGSDNIIIGYNLSNTSATASNKLNIGGLIFGTLDTKRIRIGAASPTAALHLPASTTSAASAPIKMETGTLMDTPEAGAIEYDGTNLYFTDSTGTRKTLAVTA
jgi:hypothetical protein